MLALTPRPDRAIPVLWQNFIRTFNVPGRLDTVPSAHSRSLASVRFLPQTRTPLRVGAKCGRPHRGSNRALTTGTSVGFQHLYPLGHGGDKLFQLNRYQCVGWDSQKLSWAEDITFTQVDARNPSSATAGFRRVSYDEITVGIQLRAMIMFTNPGQTEFTGS